MVGRATMATAVEEASKSSDDVADQEARSQHIEVGKNGNSFSFADKRRNEATHNESSKTREALELDAEQLVRMLQEVRQVLDDEKGSRAQDAGKNGPEENV